MLFAPGYTVSLTEVPICTFGCCFQLVGCIHFLDRKAMLDLSAATSSVNVRRFVMLTKWSCLTRLETRTKESNIYASIRVQNPNAQ